MSFLGFIHYAGGGGDVVYVGANTEATAGSPLLAVAVDVTGQEASQVQSVNSAAVDQGVSATVNQNTTEAIHSCLP